MGRKIFVSYKYKDRDVQGLPGVSNFTWVRDYVDYIADHLIESGNIYKGEDNTEDLSNKSDEYIWGHLKNKIYDSSVTIVLISPNMRESYKWERSQWIPWEIAYSLRETRRSDYTSHSNAILAVILPNKSGSYSYYKKDNLFTILRENIDNGYIFLVQWDDFIKHTNSYIELAIQRKENTPTSRIVKTV
jgi:hypothetical protein